MDVATEPFLFLVAVWKCRRFLNSMIRRGVYLVALLGLGLTVARPAETAQGQFDNLIKSSPFGQAPAGAAQAGNGSAPLEFRGVFQEQGNYFFSVHETSNRAGQWVGLKEANQPYVVESYDSEKGSIQVKYHGQTMTLSLKQAQVIVQAPPPITAPLPTNTPGVMTNAAPADEANRLAQVAEEIRRRRALRSPIGAGGSLPQPASPNLQPRPTGPAATNIRP